MLDACRQYGFGGPQPIALRETLAWMTEIGLHAPQDRATFLDVVLFIDHEHLTICAADREQKANQRK